MVTVLSCLFGEGMTESIFMNKAEQQPRTFWPSIHPVNTTVKSVSPMPMWKPKVMMVMDTAGPGINEVQNAFANLVTKQAEKCRSDPLTWQWGADLDMSDTQTREEVWDRLKEHEPALVCLSPPKKILKQWDDDGLTEDVKKFVDVRKDIAR